MTKWDSTFSLWGSVQLGAGSGDYEAGRREAPAGGLNIRREYTAPRVVAIDIMTSQGTYIIVPCGNWNKVFVQYKAVS